MSRNFSVTAVAAFVILLSLLALGPGPASAQGNGSIWAVQGAAVPEFFNFSVTGQTFVATVLTFGNGGNGRWFAAFGGTNGVNGSGQVLNPSGFQLAHPPGANFTFQLDAANSTSGSFATTGLQSFLSLTSGRMVRIFP